MQLVVAKLCLIKDFLVVRTVLFDSFSIFTIHIKGLALEGS